MVFFIVLMLIMAGLFLVLGWEVFVKGVPGEAEERKAERP